LYNKANEFTKGTTVEDRDSHLRFYFILLLVAVMPLFALGLSNHGVWTPDEPRVAEIGREMALSGNWAVPTLDQKPFLEEPPLYYAAIAAVFETVGGASDRTVRIPSAVFGFGGILALFFLVSMLFGPRTGFISAFVMATCGEYFRVAHWVVVDSALACFVVLSLACFMAAYLSENGTKRILFYGLCYVACTLAFYAKGFIGVAIPALAVLSFLVFDRNVKEILKMHLWLGTAIFLVMTLPWFLALWREGGAEYLKVFFVHNHLDRFAGGSTGHSQPFYYYLTQFPGGFLPWSILIIPVLYWSFRKPDPAKGRSEKAMLFAKCWFVTGFLFLSAASTKRVLYLMPIFAPISLLTARYIEATLTGMNLRSVEKVFNFAFGIVILAVSVAVIPLFFYASQRYALGFPARETVSIILLSLIALILAIAAMVKFGKNMGRFWTFSGASVFALLLLGLVAVVPLIDRYKSFVPFCDAIRLAVPPTATLYGYQADETLRGAVPFYMGRFLKEIETPQELEEALRNEKTTFVVTRDKGGEVERELLSTGKVSVIARFGMDASRSLVLLEGPRVSGMPRERTGP
jgi:4-amino-4-deoxy-L-arabinose transferase-like glycosyltransferase